MLDWLTAQPLAMGAATLLLMWSDWLLTILQERERSAHYGRHYESYPIDTIEGSSILRSAVAQRRFVHRRHLLPALVLSGAVAYAVTVIPKHWLAPFAGYVWGLFLIVDSTHLGNLIGYRAGRRGLHGKIWMHQRTGYVIQMGRYLALAALLIVLAAVSGSPFIAGVAVAGLTSALRQIVWLRRTPAVPPDDAPPAPPNPAARRAE